LKQWPYQKIPITSLPMSSIEALEVYRPCAELFFQCQPTSVTFSVGYQRSSVIFHLKENRPLAFKFRDQLKRKSFLFLTFSADSAFKASRDVHLKAEGAF